MVFGWLAEAGCSKENRAGRRKKSTIVQHGTFFRSIDSFLAGRGPAGVFAFEILHHPGTRHHQRYRSA